MPARDKLAAELAAVYPELAKKLGTRCRDGIDFPRITHVLRLPTFEYSLHEPYVWPPVR
jgi:hypothetical protein